MPGSGPLVFGPAYLDRVLRVDRPLVDRSVREQPLDGSVDGTWLEPGEGLTLLDPLGHRLILELPGDWPGPSGTVGLSRPLARTHSAWSRTVPSLGWHDDLGGMGAGFAAALGGELVSALGPEDDPASRAISELLARVSVTHHPIRVEGRSADWTLLVSSGEHGDKLPIGFRGCHASLSNLSPWSSQSRHLRVVASLPNRLASEALRGPGTIRAFAPALRNMIDRDPPVSAFADSIDILTCNRGEWEQLDDREQVAWLVSILVVTDGPHGATIRFTTPDGEAGRSEVPAFPRAHPPRDTNRAGEAFASTLLATLLENGWTPGVTPPDLARLAADRAAVAAALELDRADFGFPTRDEIDFHAALRAGRSGLTPAAHTLIQKNRPTRTLKPSRSPGRIGSPPADPSNRVHGRALRRGGAICGSGSRMNTNSTRRQVFRHLFHGSPPSIARRADFDYEFRDFRSITRRQGPLSEAGHSCNKATSAPRTVSGSRSVITPGIITQNTSEITCLPRPSCRSRYTSAFRQT